MKYLVVIERGPTSFGAYVPDLPGCVAVAATREEITALAGVRGALRHGVAGGALAQTALASRALTSICGYAFCNAAAPCR